MIKNGSKTIIPINEKKKSKNLISNITMTIADHIREETTLTIIKNLFKEGYDASFIAKVTELSVKKVQDIIQKIKESNL